MLLQRAGLDLGAHLVGRRTVSRDRATILVIQDKLIRVQKRPEQILQDLEAIRERFEILPCSSQLFGRGVPAERRQVEGIHHVRFR